MNERVDIGNGNRKRKKLWGRGRLVVKERDIKKRVGIQLEIEFIVCKWRRRRGGGGSFLKTF